MPGHYRRLVATGHRTSGHWAPQNAVVVLKEQKYHLYLSKDEYSEVLQSLIRLKNSLIAQGRYTDAADDILCKVLSAKKRKFKIKYI